MKFDPHLNNLQAQGHLTLSAEEWVKAHVQLPEPNSRTMTSRELAQSFYELGRHDQRDLTDQNPLLGDDHDATSISTKPRGGYSLAGVSFDELRSNFT
jgi:hypothetical protein